jgi:hypothetical protein
MEGSRELEGETEGNRVVRAGVMEGASDPLCRASRLARVMKQHGGLQGVGEAAIKLVVVHNTELGC